MQGKVRWAGVCILLALLISGVQAYIITIDAPGSVFVGSPLIVTGTTSFPTDTSFDLTLYYSKYTSDQVAKLGVIVDENKEFRVAFDTKGLDKGQYKVEVHNIVYDNELFVESQLGSASTLRRVVQLIDRSDEIIITSPATQPLAQALTVAGEVKGLGQGVITMRIFGPDGYTYGPEQILTTTGYADQNGHFSSTVAVSIPGEYQVSISDKTGFIGEYPFIVTAPDTPAPEVTETKEITVAPTATVSPLPTTPAPEPTKSPACFATIPAALAGLIIFLKRQQ